MEQSTEFNRLWHRPIVKIIASLIASLIATVVGAFFLGVFTGGGIDVQKYGENIGRNLLAQPSVENIKSAARAKKQKIDCEKELLKSVAEDENRVRSAKKNLKDCEADFRHWALGQSCEIYERVVAATEARLSVMKEPGGC